MPSRPSKSGRSRRAAIGFVLIIILLISILGFYYIQSTATISSLQSRANADEALVNTLNARNAQQNGTIQALNSQISFLNSQITSYQTEINLQDSVAILSNSTIDLGATQTYPAVSYNVPHAGFLKIDVETPLVTQVCFYDYVGYGYSVYTYVEGSYNGETYHVDVANGTLSPYYMAVLPGSITVYLQSNNPCESQTLSVSVTFDGL